MIENLTRTRVALGAISLAAVLAACSGGGTSIPAASGGAGGNSSALAPAGGGTAAIAITVPAAGSGRSAVNRHYISSATQSLSIATDGANPQNFDLTPTSKGCTTSNGATTCTESLSVPAGQHTFTLTTYSQTGSKGAALSTNTTPTETITAGKTTNIGVTLDGIVAAATLTLQNAHPPAGTPANIGLTVSLLDAAGKMIIGSAPFENQITLTTSNATVGKLSKTALNSPADESGISVAYNGANTSVTFSATGNGLSASNVTNAVLTPSGGGVPTPTATATGTPKATPTPVSTPTPTSTPKATPTPTGTPTGAPTFPAETTCGSFPDPNHTTVPITGADGQIIVVPPCGDFSARSRLTGNSDNTSVTLQTSNDNKFSSPATINSSNGTAINEATLQLSNNGTTFTTTPDTCVLEKSPSQIVDNPFVTYTVEVESFGSDSQTPQTGLTPDASGYIHYQLTSPLGGGKSFPGGVQASIVVYRVTHATAQPRNAGASAGCPASF